MSPWIIYIYVLISLVIAFTVFSAGWRAGLSAIGTSFFAFVAGAGLRGGLYGTTRQKVAGLGIARRAYGITKRSQFQGVMRGELVTASDSVFPSALLLP